jgi:hypothetical protein
MAKVRIKINYNHLPPPPCVPSWCTYKAVEIAPHLTSKHKARKWQVEYLLGMLNESYIVKLPCLKKYRSNLFDKFPQQLLWLWCS